MGWTLGILLGLVAVVLASLAWRVASRHWSLPCPSLLAWSFEGSVADWVSGTQRTLDRMELTPGQTILEVGPGPGRLLIPAAGRILPGGKAIGIDMQPKMIDRLNVRAKEAGVTNLTAQVGDATRLELADAMFDVVFLCTVVGEIPDRAAALAECFRVLKPGGMLAITEMFGDPHYQSRSKLQQLTAAAGFVPAGVEGNAMNFTARFRKP